MRITFILGNGFDLGVGMKSSYPQFYDYLLKKNIRNMITNRINNDRENWADFELACGNEFKNIQESELNEFISSFENLKLEFRDYLKTQQDSIVYEGREKELSDFFCDCVDSFYTRLSPLDARNIKSRINNTGEAIIYDFVTFNYTNILDNFIILSGNKGATIGKHVKGTTTCTHLLGNLLHIHGTLDSDMIMGVNDEAQIHNDKFKKLSVVKNLFIKPFLNDRLKNLRNDEMKDMINKSSIICIFGASIGDTDSCWWEMIGDWLKNGASRILIVYGYIDEQYLNPILSNKKLDKEDADKEMLLNKFNLTNEEKERVQDRILFSYNSGLFAIKLVKDEQLIKEKVKQ